MTSRDFVLQQAKMQVMNSSLSESIYHMLLVIFFKSISKITWKLFFRYQIGNNEIFRGQTFELVEDIRFMFGKDNIVFWVKLTRDDYEKAKTKSLLKSVRLGMIFFLPFSFISSILQVKIVYYWLKQLSANYYSSPKNLTKTPFHDRLPNSIHNSCSKNGKKITSSSYLWNAVEFFY